MEPGGSYGQRVANEVDRNCNQNTSFTITTGRETNIDGTSSVCIICRRPFKRNSDNNAHARLTVCLQCLDSAEQNQCDNHRDQALFPGTNRAAPRSPRTPPRDMSAGGHLSRPANLSPAVTIEESLDGGMHALSLSLDRLRLFLRSNEQQISIQLRTKVDHLLELKRHEWQASNHGQYDKSRPGQLVKRLRNLLARLLLELIQAHYNTKQREQDLVKLVAKLGCSLAQPELIDAVCVLLVKLYSATGDRCGAWYERSVLLRYLNNELDNAYAKTQVSRVLQGLYRANCFELSPGPEPGSSARLRLKRELCHSPDALRQHHDAELVKLASQHYLRLPPESWAHLLNKREAFPAERARMQALLDAHQPPACVPELAAIVCKFGDPYKLRGQLEMLGSIESQLAHLEASTGAVSGAAEASSLAGCVETLLELGELFVLRHASRRPAG